MNQDVKSPPARRRSVTTIKKIAALAGVSTATVSRVINTPEIVKKKTRQKVNSIMRRHHFVVDGIAGSLASQRSRTIGLIIPTVANSIYASSTQAIQRVAQANGYAVFVGISDFSADLEAALIHRLIERRVDGLILTGAERAEGTYRKINHNNVPFVVTWQLTGSLKRPTVSFDNFQAAQTATEHLLSLGHRKVGLICGRTHVNDRAFERRRAYEASLEKYGVEVHPDYIHECEFEMFEGRAAMSKMIELQSPPTAVFCANDIQAVGAIAACHDAQLRVPDDISIVGFDDLPIAQCISPALTTVRVPADEMGSRAAEALIGAINGTKTITTLELPTLLVVRESTCAWGRQTPRC